MVTYEAKVWPRQSLQHHFLLLATSRTVLQMRLPLLSPSNVSSSFLGQDFLLMLFLHIKPKSASLLVFNCMLLQWKCGYMPPLCNVCVLSRVWHFATPQTVAHQAPLSLGFSRQEYPCLTEGTIRISQDLGASRKRYNHAEAGTHVICLSDPLTGLPEGWGLS